MLRQVLFTLNMHLSLSLSPQHKEEVIRQQRRTKWCERKKVIKLERKIEPLVFLKCGPPKEMKRIEQKAKMCHDTKICCIFFVCFFDWVSKLSHCERLELGIYNRYLFVETFTYQCFFWQIFSLFQQRNLL